MQTPNEPSRLKQRWLVWKKRPTTWIAAGVLLIVAAGSGVIAATDLKYPVAGLVVRTDLSLTVTDELTRQPVPRALVEFGGVADLTDKNGQVTLHKVKPGKGVAKVKKAGYSEGSRDLTAPFGKPADQSMQLRPNGIKVTAQAVNALTGAGLEGVEVKAGEASALTDKTGRATLSLPVERSNQQQTIEYSKDGFNVISQPIVVQPAGQEISSKLVPSGKAYFQSNRSGKIDLYESNLDGSDATVVLAGTGNELETTGILPNVNDHKALALVSAREGRRVNGQLVQDLFVFNVETKKLTKIDDNIYFTSFRAWVGDYLVYEKPYYDPSFGTCNELKAYRLSTGKSFGFYAQNAVATGCGSIKLATRDGVFYSVHAGGDINTRGFYFAKPQNETTKRISGTPASNVVRRVKDTLLSEYYTGASTPPYDTWESINIGSFIVTRLNNGPSVETSRYYNDSASGKHSAFIEERDGKAELYLTDSNGQNEKKLTAMGSANQLVQWYGDDYIIFSSTKAGENALYVVATDGSAPPVKVTDFFRGNGRTYGGGGNSYY